MSLYGSGWKDSVNTNNSENIEPVPPISSCWKHTMYENDSSITDEVVVQDIDDHEYLDLMIQEVEPYRTNIISNNDLNIKCQK